MIYGMRWIARLLCATLAFAPTATLSDADNGPIIPMIRIRSGQPDSYVLISGSRCRLRRDKIASVQVDESRFSAILAKSSRRIVVFVPGFGTSVPLAYSAAQRIQIDLGSVDRVVFVDWGSVGRKSAYELDARTVRRNAPALAATLRTLRRIARGKELDVFAHSLGTRLVALAIPAFTASDGTVVRNVVFAAPDMTIKAYQNAIAREPGPVRHITLYVSHKDRALLLSEIIHLHRRLGQITHWSRALANTDVVDASVASRGLDGHGYAINETELIKDVGLTLAGGPVPHPLWRKAAQPGMVGWVFISPRNRPADDSIACASAVSRS